MGLAATEASAGLCDYKPSALFGGAVATTIGTTAVAGAGTGSAMAIAGFYTLTHSTSGLTMLASTAATTVSPSAAGTVGIIGGTGGLVGSVSAFVMAPATIVTAAVTAAGMAAYEGACVFAVERLTDPEQINALMNHLAEQADPEFFRLTNLADGRAGIFVRDGDSTAIYAIEDLYIADGVLKHREWLLDETIGQISWVDLIDDDLPEGTEERPD